MPAVTGFLLALSAACVPPEQDSLPALTGPYLGQTPPGAEPKVFAPGIVSTGMYTRDIAMTPDGSEMYWCVMESGYSVIMGSRLVDGRWTQPEVVPFSADAIHQEIEPHITPDGQRMLFLSDRRPDGLPLEPEERGRWAYENIWVVDRVGDGWGEPHLLDAPINSDSTGSFFPSMTRDGTIYFSRSVPDTPGSSIYRSRLVDGEYTEPERLPSPVNDWGMQFNAFVDPDERFLIMPSRGPEGGDGRPDYYVTFRSEDDTWSEPLRLPDVIDTGRSGNLSAYVSPDGRYLFFLSTRRTPWEDRPDSLSARTLQEIYDAPGRGNADIWWVDAGFIHEMRAASQ
jgi:hypothetical protein